MDDSRILDAIAHSAHRLRGGAGDFDPLADARPADARDDFTRFPLWMWRNRETLHLIERLRALNEERRPEAQVGFCGLDARLSPQFDAVLHFDRTRALAPLDRVGAWARAEAPETYPFGE